MSSGWAGPAWGEPSSANQAPIPLRALSWAGEASYRAEGGVSDDFLVLAAAVSGVSHRLGGRRCEDSFGWAHPTGGRLALVIADGVSTAGRGGEGADLAVQAACRYLARPQENWGEMECLAAVHAASQDVMSAGGAAAAELSTTIVVALVVAAAGRARATVARAGDSTAFTLAPGGAWREVFGPHGSDLLGGDAANGNGERGAEAGEGVDDDVKPALALVLPLSSRDQSLEVTTVELADEAALVLLSDGVADPLRDGPNTVAPALAGAVLAAGRGELSPLALARAADFSRRGAHDDRTVLVAWPRGGH